MPPVPNPTKSLPSFFFLLLSLILPPSALSSAPFSTLAISHQHPNVVIVCALVTSPTANRYDLNCTLASTREQFTYPAGATPYAAVAAGNGFLCGLTLPADQRANSTMRWWAFPDSDHSDELYHRRIYWGPQLTALASGDTHVCGLIERRPHCWRWEEIRIREELLRDRRGAGLRLRPAFRWRSAVLRERPGVVGQEPPGNFSLIAAGTWHACAASVGGRVTCWGAGSPAVDPDLSDIAAMALGENRTCVLLSNGTVLCWGEGARPPDCLAGEQFIGIQARGDAICGILSLTFSVVCWGNKLFWQNHTVYSSVLPGTCSPISSCGSCGVLPGSGNMCPANEGICQSCKFQSSPPSSNVSSGGRKRWKLYLILGSVGFGLGLLVLLSLLVYRALRNQGDGRVYPPFWLRRRRQLLGALSFQVETPSEGQLGDGTVKEFSLQFIFKITDNFSEAQKIGSGSFGAVYRATLPGGREVAIKRADISASAAPSTSRRHEQLRRLDQEQRERAFYSELEVLSRINHKNLVRLLGFCRERGERVLVYEYMVNRTLHDNLHRRPLTPSSPLSSWTTRLRLALDAARGIEYLHAYAVPPIIHRDIKSSNILLDEEWTAKVADFGLSLTRPEDEGSIAAGTVGYMDPEYYRLRRLTEKSDVYSFGVVLLELVTGCKAIHRSQDLEGEEAEGSTTPRNVVEMAVPYIEIDDVARVMDRRVETASPEEFEAVAYVGYVAAECVRAECQDRPAMGEVVGALERAYAACALVNRNEQTAVRRTLSRAPSFL